MNLSPPIHMSPSESFGMSLFGVFIVALIVAFVAAAILRRPLGKSLLPWLGAFGLLVVAALFGVRSMSFDSSTRALEARRAAIDHMHEMQSRSPFQSDAASSMAMAEFHGPATTWSTTRVHTTRSWGVLFIALLVPFFIFLISRLIRRAGRGESADASRSSSPWSWLAAAAACFVILGGYFGTSRTVQVTAPQPAMIEQHAAVASDELWDRLTEGQIQVSNSRYETENTTTSRYENTTADGHEDAANAHSHEHVSETDAHDDAEAPSHGVRDDFSLGEGQPASKSARLEKLYAQVSDEETSSDDEPQQTRFVDGAPTEVAEAKIPAPRPDWIGERRNLVVNGVRRVVIEAGPYTQLQECHNALRQEMVKAVQSHLHAVVVERTHDPLATVPPLAALGIGENTITREFLVDQFVEDSEASFGLTKTAWGLLEFNENADANLYNAWRAYARRSRIRMIVLLAGLAVSAVGGVFALLKIDTWTRGYYTKRLFLGVPAAIIGIITGFLMLIAATS
jgi:hypothetical protein